MRIIDFADTSWLEGSPSNQIVCGEFSLLNVLLLLEQSDNVVWFKVYDFIGISSNGTKVELKKLISEEKYKALYPNKFKPLTNTAE
jgi:hypothetical protein